MFLKNRYHRLGKAYRSIRYRHIRLRDRWGYRRRKRGAVVEQWPGEAADVHGGKLCLFASYDPHGLVDPYVFRLLDMVYDQGYQVVFVTGAPSLTSEDLSELQKRCVRVVRKKNVGWDFGSWKIASEQVDHLSSYSEVLLLNDSIYGPLTDPGLVFQQIAQDQESDVIGLTDSWEVGWHLQSYFLVLRPRFLRSDFFQKLWASPDLFSGRKEVIIQEFEIGLSQKAVRAGFRLRALFPYRTLIPGFREVLQTEVERLHQQSNHVPPPMWRKWFTANVWLNKSWWRQAIYYHRTLDHLQMFAPLNPLHYMGLYLIESHQFPFIKAEYVRENPMMVCYPRTIAEVLQGKAGFYDPEYLYGHLRRTAQHQVPF